MNLLNALASKLWQCLPRRIRRLGVLLTESRFTATAGAVITDDAGRVLLLQHRFRPGSGWGIPGGFLQPGEQPEAAIRRELREETGLEVRQLELVFVRALEPYQQIEIIFRCVPNGDLHPQSHEINRAEWFPLDALPANLSDDQRHLIETALLKPATCNLQPATNNLTMFIHSVYFWLKSDLTEAQREEFWAGAHSLTTISSVRHGFVGTPAATDRPIIDRSYSCALIIICDDEAGHEAYQVDPIHDRFREECGEFWSKVLIYDAVTGG